MAWTDDRVATLTKMWEGGATATEIAKVLEVTRNAVIGKAHRLGLSGRPSPIKKKKKQAEPKAAPAKQAAASKAKDAEAPAEAAAAPSTAKAAPEAAAREEAPAAEVVETPVAAAPPKKDEPPRKGITLMELTERTCRWPFGDPQDLDNFYFCGKACDPGVSYCETHAARAYQQPNARKDEATKKAMQQAEARKKQEAAEAKAKAKS